MVSHDKHARTLRLPLSLSSLASRLGAQGREEESIASSYLLRFFSVFHINVRSQQ
jgi:hypothetical protein